MRFNLVDRIVEWEPGKSLKAVKALTMGEEYLRDHFPTFPVMPGVLMLQSTVESASWLWRITSGFQHSIIALREVRSVKYGTFMEPGRRMEIAVEWKKTEGPLATFVGKCNVEGGAQTVSAQIVLEAYNAADRSPVGSYVDEKLAAHWRERFAWLSGELIGKKQ